MVSPAWNIRAVPNGGYSLAIVLGAMRAVGGHADPLSLTCHYLRPVDADAPARATTDVVRSGRTVSTVSGRLLQEGKDRLVVMAALGNGAGISAGVDHPAYSVGPIVLPPEIRDSLARDIRPTTVN